MMAIGYLQESSTTMDVSWLVWVLLAVFVLMVFLGWWASGRLPKEEETITLDGRAHSSHDESSVDHEVQEVAAGQSAGVANQEDRVAEVP